jgi:hypothetical protein
MEEVVQSYDKDLIIQTLIQELQQSPASHPHYTWVNGHLNRKGKIVVGSNEEL